MKRRVAISQKKRANERTRMAELAAEPNRTTARYIKSYPLYGLGRNKGKWLIFLTFVLVILGLGMVFLQILDKKLAEEEQ